MPKYPWTKGNPKLFIPQRAVPPAPAGPGLRVGAAVADVTPALGVPLSGYGFLSKTYGRHVWGRLLAHVLVVDDGSGSRVAIVAVDLHAGSRYLAHRAAQLLSPTLGLGVERIVLTASHSHAGPGHYYGDSFYDDFATARKGFDQAYAEAASAKIAGAITAACAALTPGRLGFGEGHVDGILWNRSVLASLANEGPVPPTPAAQLPIAQAVWHRINGSRPPPAGVGTEDAVGRAYVDARLRVVWAETTAGVPVAALGFLNATPTTIHANKELMSGDVSREASRLTAIALGDAALPVALTGGNVGDTNVVDATMAAMDYSRWRKDATLRDNVGSSVALAGVLANAFVAGAAAAKMDAAIPRPGLAVVARYDHFVLPGAPARTWVPSGLGPFLPDPMGDPTPHLPPTIEVGEATLAGSEFSPTNTPFHEPAVDLSAPRDGQWPKKRIPAWLESWRGHRAGDPAPFMGLRYVRLGDVCTLLAHPGEMTVGLGEDVATAIGARTIIASLAGGDLGYLTTPSEYLGQYYEGSSMWWGRMCGALLVQRFRALEGGATGAAPGAPFPTEIRAIETKLRMPFGLHHPHATDAGFVLTGGLLTGWWTSRGAAIPPLCDKAIVRIVAADGGADPLAWGQVADDRSLGLLVTREVWHGDGFVRWSFRAFHPVPPGWSGRKITFAVALSEAAPRAGDPTWGDVTVP